ncbi:hypothetical protein COOONC_28194 [Cooperia oncophora]
MLYGEPLVPIPAHPTIAPSCETSDKKESTPKLTSQDMVKSNQFLENDGLQDVLEAQLNDSGSTVQSVEMLGFNAVPKSPAVAPEPSDLPDPSLMFTGLCSDDFFLNNQNWVQSATQSSSCCTNSTTEGSAVPAQGVSGDELLIQLDTENTSLRNQREKATFMLTPEMSPVEHSSVPASSTVGVPPHETSSTSSEKGLTTCTSEINAANHSLDDVSKPETSREPVDRVSSAKEDSPLNPSSLESAGESDPSMKLLEQAGIFPIDILQTMPEKLEENGSQPSRSSGVNDPRSTFESTPTCFRVSQVDAALGSQPSQTKSTGEPNGRSAAPHDSQANEINSKLTPSVLDGLKFPDIDATVIQYLTFIRKQVMDYHENQGVIPRLENILACLRETISNEWIDYVLYYISDVSVMPVDGQV